MKSWIFGIVFGACVYSALRFGAYASIPAETTIAYTASTCPASRTFASKLNEQAAPNVLPIQVDKISVDQCRLVIREGLPLVYSALPKTLVCRWLREDAAAFYKHHHMVGFPAFSKGGVPLDGTEAIRITTSVNR